MQQESTTRRKQRTIKCHIGAKYNAAEIEAGDTLTVEPCDSFTDGDIVVLEDTASGLYRAVYLYNTSRKNAHGTPFKYSYNTRRTRGHAGSSYIYGDPAKDSYKIIGKIIKTAEKPAKQKAKRAAYNAVFNWSYFGVHYNDGLTVEENGRAKVGQLILMQDENDPDYSYFTRVCLLTDETVRVAGKINSEPCDYPRSLIVGAVVEIDHSECNHTRVIALRKQIAKLQSDNDAWANSTRIAELEAEIYELEQQEQTDDEASEEWPDVIGAGGESDE